MNEFKWKKSTRSMSSNCVEVQFVKSSQSVEGNCVEVATCSCHVQVRDSKDPDGPKLTFTHAEWSAFLGGVRDGEFGD